MCCARLCGLILLLTLELQASAAPPTVNYLYPAGGQRGQTVEATAAGSFAHWPPQCRVNRQGLTVTPAKDKGKVSIAVAADAVPGAYLLQFYDAEGAAAPQPFIVGTLAEASEQEPNDSPDKPQTLSSAAVTVNGKLQKGGDVDAFSMGLMQGQTLVASLDANRTLGSPVDAVLQIASPRGTVLAQNDDERGLDPQLIFVAPSTGSYLVRVFGFPAAPNTTIALAGADTYVYRLTITTGAFLDAAFPLAVAKDASTSLELIGWNLPDAATRRELRPAAGAETVEVFDPSLADSLTLPVEPHPSLVEIEPNPPEQSQLVQLPVTLTGRIGDRRDKDAYRFSAKKGDVLRFQIESRDLGYPLDSVLELFKAEGGAPVARADDNAKQADADLTYTIPADGEYRIVVSDLYQHFGPHTSIACERSRPRPISGSRSTLKPLPSPQGSRWRFPSRSIASGTSQARSPSRWKGCRPAPAWRRSSRLPKATRPRRSSWSSPREKRLSRGRFASAANRPPRAARCSAKPKRRSPRAPPR